MSGWGVSLIWAWLWDRLLGDPRSDWHPVCLVGNLISKLEAAFRRPYLSSTALLWRGGIVSILVLIIVTVVAFCVRVDSPQNKGISANSSFSLVGSSTRPSVTGETVTLSV